MVLGEAILIFHDLHIVVEKANIYLDSLYLTLGGGFPTGRG